MSLYYATDELLADASALGSISQNAFTEDIQWMADDAIMNGSGVGQPLGWMNGGAMVSVAKEGSQAADTILAENLNAMWARLHPRSRKSAIWLYNADCQPELDNLFYSVKNAAGSDNVGGFRSAVYNSDQSTIKGRPAIAHESCATIGDTGDILLVDPAAYVTIDKGGIQSASSMHVQFLTDEMTFRFTYRLDGQPMQHTALTPANGSNTLSTYLKLDARA